MMRIITGKYRGRRLRVPRGWQVRPTADRLRESIFNIIGPALRGHNVVDIFAGTGAMGVEALSRGADYAVFIDNHPKALKAVRTNMAPLGCSDQWRIIRWDAGTNLRCLASLGMRFGYAFIDPPYNMGLVARALENLVASQAMLPDGLIVLEHHCREGITPMATGAVLEDQRRYGKTLVTFLRIVV
jgi:16S rRNA (guanine(966)-N(2))-methyltransferase RsmD